MVYPMAGRCPAVCQKSSAPLIIRESYDKIKKVLYDFFTIPALPAGRACIPCPAALFRHAMPALERGAFRSDIIRRAMTVFCQAKSRFCRRAANTQLWPFRAEKAHKTTSSCLYRLPKLPPGGKSFLHFTGRAVYWGCTGFVLQAGASFLHRKRCGTAFMF